jgi:hypothetical protein
MHLREKKNHAYFCSAQGYLSSHELSEAGGEGQSGDEQSYQCWEEQASRDVGFTSSDMAAHLLWTGHGLGALTYLRAEVRAQPWLLCESTQSQEKVPFTFFMSPEGSGGGNGGSDLKGFL